MNKHTKVLINALLLIGWASLIAIASSQPYTDQDLRPMLGELNNNWVECFFGWVSFSYGTSTIRIEEIGAAAFLEFFIRKSTHVVVFFILGFLVMRLFSAFRMSLRISAPVAFLSVFIFAAMDEYRHFLHPERTGLLEDVVLDGSGGALGIAVYIFWRAQKKIEK